jgi:hypothetical protein
MMMRRRKRIRRKGRRESQMRQQMLRGQMQWRRGQCQRRDPPF